MVTYGSPDGVAHRLPRIRVAHAAVRAHDIAKRQIRNEAAERNASPFEDGGRFRAVEESSSEFVDEPRLAHARLADDADHLSLAGQRRRDQPLQQRALLVA